MTIEFAVLITEYLHLLRKNNNLKDHDKDSNDGWIT